MLYIFQVDTGTMLTFDMNLAMESVSTLHDVVSTVCRIPRDKQVLLISGGENLNPNARVCSYSAGTDSNPIFLFSKSSIESAAPPSASVNYGSEADLQDQVDGSLNMPPTYETVVARAQLALQFHETDREELRICERLVHDQHLQHQGWGAVIANLEDITSEFQARSKVFSMKLEHYLTSRELHMATLASFTEDLQLLSRIPLLPCLLRTADQRSEGDERSESEERSEGEQGSDGSQGKHLQPKTLLDWISAQDNRMTLKQLAEQCHLGLQQFDERVQESLMSEVNTLLEALNNASMKEVKGLEDRLCGLAHLMCGARKIVQEQADMAQGFVQNQNRARNLADTSILPDLSNSHKKQLVVMLQNHQSLRDIRRRCSRAKEELSVNLHTRLRWVMYVEKTICDLDSRLVVHHDTLRKLRRRLHVIKQVHSAPWLYARSLLEAVRRQSFSTHFLQWSGELAEQCSELHNQEVAKRKQFASCLKNHFLQLLFPGFDEMPPAFAVEKPAKFDSHLPTVCAADLSQLQDQVPELAEHLQLTDSGSLSKLRALVKLDSYESSNLNSPRLAPCPSDSHTHDASSPFECGGAGCSSKSPVESGTDDYDISQSVEILDSQQIPADVEFQQASPVVDGHELRNVLALSEAVPQSTPVDVQHRLGWSEPRCIADLDQSDVFTTADFFIDESLPSPLTVAGGGGSVGVAALRAGLVAIRSQVALQQQSAEAAVADTTTRICASLAVVQQHTQERLHALQAELRAKNTEKDAVEEQLRCKTAERDSLESSLMARTDELTACNDQLQRTLAEIAAIQSRLNDSVEALAARDCQLEAEQAKCVDLERQLFEVNAVNVDLETSHQTELVDVQNRLETLINDKCKQLNAAEQRIADLDEEIARRTDEAESKERDFVDRIAQAEKSVLDTATRDRECLEESHRTKISELEAQLASTHAVQLEDCRKRYECQLAELITQHALEMAELKEQAERPEVTEQHRDVEIQAGEEWLEEQSHLIEQAVTEERLRNKEQERYMVEKIEMEKQEVLEQLKTGLLAEKQVMFNEALEKVVAEKNKVIEQLKERETELLQEKERDHGTIAELTSKIHSRNAADTEDRRVIQRRLEEDLATAKQQILRYESESRQMSQSMTVPACTSAAAAHIAHMSHSQMVQSVVPAVESQVDDPGTMEMSAGSNVTSQDKVSIITCDIGDTVLLCLDERRDHYMVFNVGVILHFLHSECLARLGLKTNAGESRRSWILAKVVDKDYCQAKKAHNRFKVPIGTKFYRVKAVPWTRPSARQPALPHPQDHQQQQQQQQQSQQQQQQQQSQQQPQQQHHQQQQQQQQQEGPPESTKDATDSCRDQTS